MSAATPIGLTAMNEYLRARILNHPDKSQLAAETGVRYHRLLYFYKNPGTTLSSADIELLMNHYGLKVHVDLPAVPVPQETIWIVHPNNPAYEYEIDDDRKPTGKVRKIEVATPIAAE